MLYVFFSEMSIDALIQDYVENIEYIDINTYRNSGYVDWVIKLIEALKNLLSKKQVVFINYAEDVLACLDAVHITYTLVYPQCTNEQVRNLKEYAWFKQSNVQKFELEPSTSVYDFIINKHGLHKQEEQQIESEITVAETVAPKLTMERLLNDDIAISDADIREFRTIQNKLKLGLILQAKNNLNRVLKLSNTLDKLYDELLDRVDNSLATTDTASLMYTTEYLSKALSDTNQFIMSLVNNEKIQNFFIIDNSNVVNIGNERVDISTRERIRKAVEIVMGNLDYFEDGQFDKLQNPNVIDVSGVTEDVNSNT